MEFTLVSDFRVLLLAVLLLTVAYKYFRSYHSRKAKLLRRFKGPARFPLLGNSLELVEPTEVLKNMTKWERAYGPRFLMSFGGPQDVISLSEPTDLEKVLTSPLLKKSSCYNILKPWLGDGLLFSSGKKWQSRRNMLMPAFDFQILQRFQRIFDRKSQDLMNLINEKLQDGQHVLEMHSMFTKSALDTICETTMGKRLNCSRNPENLFLKATLRESQLMWTRWTSPWLRPEFMWEMSPTGRKERKNRRILDDFTRQGIEERKTELRASFSAQNLLNPMYDDKRHAYVNDGTENVAILDLLLHHQASGGDCALSDEDVRGETSTFMFAGHETTASALTWTLYLLGLHPDYQKIVCDELDEVFGEDTGREVGTKDLARLKYLDMCIKESLRLFPPVTLIAREATTEVELENGLIIPEGLLILLNIYQLHRRPDIYPDPLKYRPERFSPENISNRHAYAFIPFSTGPRNCIGQRFAYNMIKTTLVKIFRNFSAQTVTPAMEDVIAITELVLRPSDGIHVQFTPRNRTVWTTRRAAIKRRN